MNLNEQDACPKPSYTAIPIGQTKVCTCCRVALTLDKYGRSKLGRYKVRSVCKLCDRKITYIKNYGEEAWRKFEEAEQSRQQLVDQGIKICAHCQLVLPLDYFHVDVSTKDGHSYCCITCANCIAQRSKETKLTPQQILDREFYVELERLGERECKACYEIKLLEDFRKGHHTCKICYALQLKQSWLAARKIRRLRDTIRYYSDTVRKTIVSARHRAKQRGMEFNLTHVYLQALWDKDKGTCSLSGIPFAPNNNETPFRKHPFRPSLDRIDNSKGYVEGNVRWVLWALNVAFSEYGFEVYRQVAEAVLSRLSPPDTD